MEDLVRIDGIQGGHLTIPMKSAPLAVKIGANGTLKLGGVRSEFGNNVLPVTLRTKDLQGEIDIYDNSGRLVLSWHSSEEHSTQSTRASGGDSSILSPPPAQEALSSAKVSKTTHRIDRTPESSPQSILPITEGTGAGSSPPHTTASQSVPKASRSKATQPQSISQDQRTWILLRLKTLISRKDSEPFNNPVNTKAYPQYPVIIKRPMDFRTIHRNYKNSKTYYPTVDALMKDFYLVIDNAVNFNGEGHEISQKALNAKAWFEERMEKLPTPQKDKGSVISKKWGGGMNAERRSMSPANELDEVESDPPTKRNKIRRKIVEPEPRFRRVKRHRFGSVTTGENDSRYSCSSL